jgi:hypothetical protein
VAWQHRHFGNTVTVVVVLAWLTPNNGAQVSVKVVVLVSFPVDALPLRPLRPFLGNEAPVTVHDVANCEVQVRVEAVFH